jgi:hypothetical protein
MRWPQWRRNASPNCATRSDYQASTVALVPASPRRAAALAAVQAIERDIAELLRHLGVDDPIIPPPTRE